ncbi:hypothetical protein [Rhodopirellula baltica]|uniref:hypothetical protein n=1 Tax=Rhodopirellula baltica TaxID=265606 RepID=UPI001F2B9259|nr:hypothetical protein [Rhodopirellula baltica]
MTGPTVTTESSVQTVAESADRSATAKVISHASRGEIAYVMDHTRARPTCSSPTGLHLMLPYSLAESEAEAPGMLLEELERRQDDVLAQLDDLEAKLNEVLSGLKIEPDTTPLD